MVMEARIKELEEQVKQTRICQTDCVKNNSGGKKREMMVFDCNSLKTISCHYCFYK